MLHSDRAVGSNDAHLITTNVCIKHSNAPSPFDACAQPEKVPGPDAERVATYLRAILPEARLTALTAEGAALDLAALLAAPALGLTA